MATKRTKGPKSPPPNINLDKVTSESNASLPYDEHAVAPFPSPRRHQPDSSSLTNTKKRRSRSRHSPYKPTNRHHRHGAPTPSMWSSQQANGSNSDASSTPPPPPPPSLGVVANAMFNVLSLYYIHYRNKYRMPCRRLCLSIIYVLGAIIGIFLIIIVIVIHGFYVDAKRVCTPPLSSISSTHDSQIRPLVEYYIHGRGNGHYARSAAVIEDLNNAGIDVRMFIGRATMWRAYQEEQTKSQQQRKQSNDDSNRGTTTAIAVTSIMPSLDVFSASSRALERIMGDCEVAFQTSKYPLLVISDGDMPGMLRAKLGGISSVGISHGQVFSIVDTPKWLPKKMYNAWSKQGRLNSITALFSNWEIATNFLAMETRLPSGAVSRPPLRPEVINVARARLFGEPIHLPTSAVDDNPLLKDLLDHHIDISKTVDPARRRKIVISYFRDSNCDMVTRSLLEAGFDVIDFDRSFRIDSPHTSKSQNKWIVHRADPPKAVAASSSASSSASASTTKTTTGTKTNRKSKKNVNNHRRLSGVEEDHPRLIRITDRSLFVPLMAIADGVASSAGSQLMSECIYMDVPLLAMYEDHDDEQMLNVMMSRQRNHHDIKRRTHVYGMSSTDFRSAFVRTDDDGSKKKQKKRKKQNLRYASTLMKHEQQNNETATTNTKDGNNNEINKSNSNSNMQSPQNPPIASNTVGAKLAYMEFHNFVSAVQDSTVSQSYFESMWNNETKKDDINEESAQLVLDEAFNGMPDAAAIILEIIKQQQQQQQQQN